MNSCRRGNSARAATTPLMDALLVAIPLSGWLYSSAAGVQAVYLGLRPCRTWRGRAEWRSIAGGACTSL